MTSILSGLSPELIEIIHKLRQYRELAMGEFVFHEGDPAEAMYVVVSGRIEILRREPDGGERIIAGMNANEVFGEMALLTRAGRTASARALEPTLLFEIPTDCVDVMRRAVGAEGAMKLLENIFGLLAERLRQQNELASQSPGASVLNRRGVIRAETREALDVMERNLPKALGRKLARKDRLAPDEYLCREGERGDAFFFIHEGELEVVCRREGFALAVLSRIHAPAITGEMAFFSGSTRNAGVRAVTPVVYSSFSGMDLIKLKERDMDEALEALMAACRMAVFMIAKGSGE